MALAATLALALSLALAAAVAAAVAAGARVAAALVAVSAPAAPQMRDTQGNPGPRPILLHCPNLLLVHLRNWHLWPLATADLLPAAAAAATAAAAEAAAAAAAAAAAVAAAVAVAVAAVGVEELAAAALATAPSRTQNGNHCPLHRGRTGKRKEKEDYLGLIRDAGVGSSGGSGVGDGSGDGLPRPDGWKKMTISQRKRWKKQKDERHEALRF